MSILKINYENVEALSKNIASSGETFSDELKKVNEANSKLQEAWAGTDEEMYAARVAEQAIEMNKLVDVIKEISVYLENVNNAYKGAQDKIKNSLLN